MGDLGRFRAKVLTKERPLWLVLRCEVMGGTAVVGWLVWCKMFGENDRCRVALGCEVVEGNGRCGLVSGGQYNDFTITTFGIRNFRTQ